MNLKQAKQTIDKIIQKGRVHFYKPFQIAEVLRRHRLNELQNLADLESYKNISKKWRDEVSTILVGRISTSSARYQDDVFNQNACPPEAIVVLGKYNNETNGLIEAYIYKMFEYRVSMVRNLFIKIKHATPATFQLSELISDFEKKPGLKRSIDKIYEITVYALFSTIVRALRIQMSLTIENKDLQVLNDFQAFLTKVIGFKEGSNSLSLPASLFRLGSTNAADRGLDIISNFGPAIQVKHLTLNSEEIGDICEGLSADKIIIVCKDSEVSTLDAVIEQLGLKDRLQSIVTFKDLESWYQTCLNENYSSSLGVNLLADFVREFSNEFPSLEGLDHFMTLRGYDQIQLRDEWQIIDDESVTLS